MGGKQTAAAHCGGVACVPDASSPRTGAGPHPMRLGPCGRPRTGICARRRRPHLPVTVADPRTVRVLCPQKEMLACSPVPVPCCGPGVSAGASGSEAVPPRVAGRNPRRRRGEEWGARTEALGGAAAGRGSLGPGTEAPPGNLISDFQK